MFHKIGALHVEDMDSINLIYPRWASLAQVDSMEYFEASRGDPLGPDTLSYTTNEFRCPKAELVFG